MKHILQFILLLAFTVCAQAQFQYRPTAFTAPFVSTINSQAAAQTYLGIESSTNNALLSGTNVFTGPNNFTVAPKFSGFGFARSIILLSTNLSVTLTAGTNATFPTNAGGYSLCGQVGQFSIPALPASWTNVQFFTRIALTKTVAGNASVFWGCYGGTATNFLGFSQAIGAASLGSFSVTGAGSPGWANVGSHTNQIANANAAATSVGHAPANLIDTSAPWTFYFGATTTGTTTSFQVLQLTVEAVNLE